MFLKKKALKNDILYLYLSNLVKIIQLSYKIKSIKYSPFHNVSIF